jgi:hypothetical protein
MKSDDIKRNKPADKGQGHDPEIRDNTGQQPGISTISSSETDENNERLTNTAKEGFNEGLQDNRADKIFDEGEE